MNQAPDPRFHPGQVLAGKYVVERLLGQGGMGMVVAARHIHLQEPVAIKLMLAEASRSPEAVARFVREARSAARLESAHVAKVSDVGTLEDGQPYMVMEYLEGQDLAQLVANSGPLPAQDAVDYVLQAAEAIAEAHSIGIIHRDLKPANLFLATRRDRTPIVKVLDFGISKVVSNEGATSGNAMTRTSAMMGSPLYMSPEQMTSVRDVDARSDIWALGVILFELVTGEPPFTGDTLPEVCGRIIQSQDPPVSSRRPGQPPELDAIVHRCLAKRPADRFPNVAALAQALRPLSGRQGRAAVERILLLAGVAEPEAGVVSAAPASLTQPLLSPTTNLPGHTEAAWGETKSSAPRSKRAWLLVPLLGTAALAATWWLRAHEPGGLTVKESAAAAAVVMAASAEPTVEASSTPRAASASSATLAAPLPSANPNPSPLAPSAAPPPAAAPRAGRRPARPSAAPPAPEPDKPAPATPPLRTPPVPADTSDLGGRL